MSSKSNPIQYTTYIPLQNFLPPLPNTPYSIAVRNMSKQVLCISFLLFFCLIISSCKAQNKNNNRNNPTCASSCGNLDNITFPFRLKDDPKYCGHSNYELDCQNDNTILTLNSKKFHVLAISYHNFSIRVVDPGLDNNNSCSFPTYSVSYDDLPSLVYNQFFDYNIPVVFINCLNPVNSSRYIDNSFCSANRTASAAFPNSSRVHNYVAVGEEMRISDLEESCSVEISTSVSVRGPMRERNSLSNIHESLASGFELSWYRVYCQECEASHGFCSLEDNTVTCRHYCPEDVPISQLGFRCQLEYWGGIIGLVGGIAVGGLVGLRFLCGFTGLMILVVYKWRRRHLSADETNEDFLQSQTSLYSTNEQNC